MSNLNPGLAPGSDNATTVRGQIRVERIVFGNATGWVVAKVTWDGSAPSDAPLGRDGRPFSATGVLGPPPPAPGDIFSVTGRWEENARFGLQLKIEQAAPILGSSEADLAAFLTHMPGIGSVRARACLRTLGREGVLAALESEDGAALAAVDGITPDGAKAIAEMYQEKKGVGDSLAFLTQLGLGKATLAKALDMWKGRARAILAADPYRLMELRGVGFAEADDIARSRLDVTRDDPRRLRAAARLACDEEENEGHCWIDVPALVVDERIRKKTKLNEAELTKGLEMLASPWTDPVTGRERPAHLVRDEQGRTWISELLATERSIVEHVRRLQQTAGCRQSTTDTTSTTPTQTEQPPPCPVCNGKGDHGTAVCWGCDGSGFALGTCKACALPSYRAPGHGAICAQGHVAEAETQAPSKAPSETPAPGQLQPHPDPWSGLVPHENQAAAVQAICDNPLLVITGGPGVGKTHTTKAVLATLEHNGLRTACAAPTGKAAQRMAEQTGRPASTIHRLLMYAPGTGFRHDDGTPEYEGSRWIRGGPLDVDAVCLDEVSMCDLRLFHAVMRALPDGCRLVLVGDVDQLPSIGPGQVLRDLIESGALPVARLTKIFRQAAESAIPWVARDINEGRMPDLADLSDVKLIPAETPEEVTAAIVHVVSRVLPFDKTMPDGRVRRGFDPLSEVLVISPQHKTDCGVEVLNRALQTALNPAGDADEARESAFIGGGYSMHAGDRVIHKRNNYDLGVFNGEMGRCSALQFRGLTRTELEDVGVDVDAAEIKVDARSDRTDRLAVIDFGDRKIAYGKADLSDLQLGFAITVHGAQGGQAPCVIIAIHTAMSYMNVRCLAYTATTRGSELVVFVGQAEALAKAARNTRGLDRRTGLAEKLRRQT